VKGAAGGISGSDGAVTGGSAVPTAASFGEGGGSQPGFQEQPDPSSSQVQPEAPAPLTQGNQPPVNQQSCKY